ncbi:MAG: stage IV sporulation protein A [Acetivibrio ethanolgignens]
MDNSIYKDIQIRTGGEIYIGVVGPVRTGKSTFIKRFMDLMVIPNMEDVHSRERAVDELPQSAAGKTIMTTEPKFIPKEAAEITFSEDTKASVRLIDCVGYMVDGAKGHIENEQERMVKTPWFEEEIPFTQAAELGTRKVITDHSTIGIVITTDGSFGEIPRENYQAPEERTIRELKNLGKPFIVLLNSNRPYSEDTQSLADTLSNRYDVTVLPVNCQQLKKEDIHQIMAQMLSAFPVSRVNFYLPKWIEMLSGKHWLKLELLSQVKEILTKLTLIKDVRADLLETQSPYIRRFKLDKINLENGNVDINVEFDDQYYYQILSDVVGTPIEGEYQLFSILRELAEKKKEYEKVGSALNEVRQRSYGVVTPSLTEIKLEEPEIIKHGNRYGVKIKALAPSIHMISADIETEIAPIVGSKEQAEDLIQYIAANGRNDKNGIWETNIFGKSIRELVEDGIQNKVHKLTDDSQLKLQEAIQKVVNDSNGGLVCIII